MSDMKNLDDVIEYLTKQREMNKVNVDEKILATARRKQLARRFNPNSRMLVDARDNPHERIVPEGFCVTCQGFTTNYDSRGCCSECGTKLQSNITEADADDQDIS